MCETNIFVSNLCDPQKKKKKNQMGMVDKALNFCFPDLNVRNGELGDFNERTFALYVF
jgi:hypothetical protein